MLGFIHDRPAVMYITAIVLVFPALLINLGMVPVIFVPDEAIRGLVSLEMMISENYIVPTLNGVHYYNKPPLFNWLIILMFELTGSTSLFAMRMVTILGLIGFALTIYYYLSKHYSRRFALFNALMFITCGRILLWDSFLALIDITFSWVIFVNFMVIYHQYDAKKYLRLFLISYLLISAAFLMKALPAVAFQGISLLVFFIYQKDFKRLFHWQHFAGMGVFVLLVGGYYLWYSQYNTLDELLPNLINESNKRTVIRYGWYETFIHLFEFPVEQLYHFAPWSLLIFFLFSKKVMREIWNTPFLKFSFLMFASNIVLYWTSPEVHPRYILMLAPLLFVLFSYFGIYKKSGHPALHKGLEYLFLVVAVAASLGMWYVPFHPDTQGIPYLWPKVVTLAVAATFFTFLYYKIPAQRMIIFVIMLLIMRIGFDWFVFPPRAEHLRQYREDAEHVGKITKGKDLYLYKGTIRDNPNSFIITRERMKILEVADNKKHDNALYLSEKPFLEGERYRELFDYTIYFERRHLVLVDFKDDASVN